MGLDRTYLGLFLCVSELDFAVGKAYCKTIAILYPLYCRRIKIIGIDHILHVFSVEKLMNFASVCIPQVERSTKSH